MAAETTTTARNNQQSQQDQAADLTRQIAERVWQLWQEDLRLERERRGRVRR